MVINSDNDDTEFAHPEGGSAIFYIEEEERLEG
jgi:hypothetical protein